MQIIKTTQTTVYTSEPVLYSFFENQCNTRFNRRCINGKIVGSAKCVGYCHYDGHPGYLTADLRKKHNCLGKECTHYVPKPKKMTLSPYEEALRSLLV